MIFKAIAKFFSPLTNKTYVVYDESQIIDQKLFDDVMKQMDKTLKAMEVFFEHTPPQQKPKRNK